MKTAMAKTSVDRYHELMVDGEVSRLQALILSMMDEGRDYTRAELSELTHLAINTVCGRVNELIKDMRLEECSARKCSITGFTAKVVCLPMAEGG